MGVNRSLARNVAKVNAKKAGVNRACSKDSGHKHDSWFSKHWRSLVKKG